MKLQVKVSPSTIVEVEGASQKEAFREAAAAAEVFGEKECGLCKSTNIRPVHRVVKPHEYFEYRCNDCGARLSLGQSTDTKTLFPNRKLMPDGKPNFKKGKLGDHNGWSHFKGEAEAE